MRIALTGGIACGKSLLSRYLNEAGVETLDADDVVHLLESPGGDAANAVFSRFGTLERAELAALCFGSGPEHDANRRDLESILFPLVRERLMSWCDAGDASVLRVAVVPLLFETGWDVDFDLIACIGSDPENQIARMMERRGMSREAAEARMLAQMPVEEKMSRSDYVVVNDGSEDELKREAAKLADYLRERAKE